MRLADSKKNEESFEVKNAERGRKKADETFYKPY